MLLIVADVSPAPLPPLPSASVPFPPPPAHPACTVRGGELSWSWQQVCLSRDTHGWGAARLKEMHANWDPTPEHMILLNVKVKLDFLKQFFTGCCIY